MSPNAKSSQGAGNADGNALGLFVWPTVCLFVCLLACQRKAINLIPLASSATLENSCRLPESWRMFSIWTAEESRWMQLRGRRLLLWRRRRRRTCPASGRLTSLWRRRRRRHNVCLFPPQWNFSRRLETQQTSGQMHEKFPSSDSSTLSGRRRRRWRRPRRRRLPARLT